MGDRWKFRAWDKENNVMVKDPSCFLTFGGQSYRFHGSWESEWEVDREEEFILMQSTGLRDKNGTLIFEGDVLKRVFPAGADIGKVSFGEYEQDGSGGEYSPTECLGFFIDPIKFLFRNMSDKESIFEFMHNYGAEIIGNVHQNPELLDD